MDIRPGTIVASTFEIQGPLGRGGMGELFRARNVRTERPIALKLLRPDAKSRADSIERFRREARASGMINSDHVTQVLDIQEDATYGIAIAFELLQGENLLDRLRRTGVMSLDVLHPLVEQILKGLCDAHAAGIIHRDLKPSNIFLEQRPDGSERVKILDFGISKLPKTINKTTLTEPGQALGSFMFMPPEQIQRAATVDQRADIYAVGTLVFQALTGHLPYSANNMVQLVQLKTSADARTLEQASGRAFPPQLQQWVSRCLMRDQNARFQTAADAAAAWRSMGPRPQQGAAYAAPANLALSTPQFPAPPTSQPYAPVATPYNTATPSYPYQPPPTTPQPYPPPYEPPPSSAQPQPPQLGSSAHWPAVPVQQAPGAATTARRPIPWLLMLAITLVIAASGVMLVLIYTLSQP